MFANPMYRSCVAPRLLAQIICRWLSDMFSDVSTVIWINVPGRVCIKAVTSSTLHWEGAGLKVVVGVEVVTAGAEARLGLRATRWSILAVMATAGSSSGPSSSSSPLNPPRSSTSLSGCSAAAPDFSFPSFSRRPALQRLRGWWRSHEGKQVSFLDTVFHQRSQRLNKRFKIRTH